MTSIPLAHRPIVSRLCLLLGLAWAAAGLSAAEPRYVERDDVREFLADMESRHGFKQGMLRRLFAQLKPQAAAIKAILPPKDPSIRSWQAYRARYIEARRIGLGLRFWEDYGAVLAAASRRYGVPEEIIVAILGVETIYGQHMGRFPALATLTTLAFDYPPRADLFRNELEAFLLLARENDADPLLVRSSYAGAIGIPQFLPSSIRRFAVDFDGDGRIDLAGSAADAIGSVANFLKEHGWESGAPVAVPAAVAGERYSEILDGSVRPSLTSAQMAEYGVIARESLPQDALCVLIDLVTPDQPTEYWLGLRNFYVLTRYNRSSFYAMAVYELSRELRAERDASSQEKVSISGKAGVLPW